MTKFKAGDIVVITAVRDRVTRHYHSIGTECVVEAGPDERDLYRIVNGNLTQWATSACFKLKRPINLENK